jgi:hypothetical protein
MPDAARGEEREGWGVSARRATWIAGGFFGALLFFIAAVGLFYHLSVPKTHASPAADPRAQSQETQRRPHNHLPLPQVGPPAPTAAQARAIDQAMGVLASEGEAGWAPLQRAPAP